MAMLHVRNLMSAPPETVSPDARLNVVLTKMNRAGYRHLPVVENGTLVGIITDRDIRLAIDSPALEDADHPRLKALEELAVADCMTPDPQCVTSDTPLHEAADALALNKFGAMPVVDGGKLVGMISAIDFLRHYADQR